MQYYYFFVGSYLFCRFEICHPLSWLWGLLWRDLMLFWFFAFFLLFFPFEGKLVFSSYNFKMLLHFVFLTSCLQYCSHGTVFLWPHLLGILNATSVWFFLPLDLVNFLVYFHWENSPHHWYLSLLLILSPGFLIFAFFLSHCDHVRYFSFLMFALSISPSLSSTPDVLSYAYSIYWWCPYLFFS